MYCPRCGTQATETTKYCRACGLSLITLSSFITTGESAPLPQAPEPKGFWQQLSPNQQMVLTILGFVFAPGILSVFGRMIGMRSLPGIAGMLMPLGIIWAVFYFKAKKDRLRRKSSLNTENNADESNANLYHPPLAASGTNPLQEMQTPRPYVHGSVTEDETKPLPKSPPQGE